MIKRLVAPALLVALTGCSTFLASRGDYALYRSTRVGKTFEARLRAADAYLRTYPDGEWAPEVKRYFERAEPVYYASKEDSVPGLQAYLAELPNGPHGKAANERLQQLLTSRVKDREDERGVVARSDAKLAARAAERAQVREQIAAWVNRFLDRDLYARPMTNADAGIVVPWALALPSPVCSLSADDKRATTGDYGCRKLLLYPYSVVSGGAQEERQATVEVAVSFDAAGVPKRATVGGPDMFLRLAESKQLQAIKADDPGARVEAIAGAVAIARERFGERIGKDKACERKSAAPVVLDLRCHGVRLTATAAVDPSEDDRFEITPSID